MKLNIRSVGDVQYFQKLWLNELIYFNKEVSIMLERTFQVASKKLISSLLLNTLSKKEEKLQEIQQEIERLKAEINLLGHCIEDLPAQHQITPNDHAAEVVKKVLPELVAFRKNYTETINDFGNLLNDVMETDSEPPVIKS